MCDIDLEPCEVFRETPVKAARKAHVCSCCGGPIRAGEGYLQHFSVYDGEVRTEKACAACVAMTQAFAKAHSGHYSNPSYMPDLLQGCVDSGDEDAAQWIAALEALRQRGAIAWGGGQEGA